MKKLILGVLLVAAICSVTLILFGRSKSMTAAIGPSAVGGSSNRAPAPLTNSRPAHAQMSDDSRLASLEKLGNVPEGATLGDWQLAKHTSWWGKRLDPKEFWKGRTVWCDKSAVAEAHARGRRYPPMPYADPSLLQISDQDREPILAGSEGWDAITIYSSREAVFWGYFNRTHPMPPEKIKNHQDAVALEANNFAFEAQKQQSAQQWDELAERASGFAIQMGCPPEALSDEALRWSFILSQRSEYQAVLSMPPAAGTLRTNILFSRMSIDANLIVNPLAKEQLQSANSWKKAYLQRLRNEKMDEAYISAYLQAWNLSSNEVFEVSN
jgi:hypothetical protein